MCHNRVMCKQLLMCGAIDSYQIDASRMGEVNEVTIAIDARVGSSGSNGAIAEKAGSRIVDSSIDFSAAGKRVWMNGGLTLSAFSREVILE